MNKLVCNFAPLRFLPYRETGEFLNVGVVVHCPQVDFFGYRLLPLEGTARIEAAFPELHLKIFTAGLTGVARELDRVQAGHQQLPAGEQNAPEIARSLVGQFQEMVRRREGLFHYGETGTLLAEEPEAALDLLFGRFVERQLAKNFKTVQGVLAPVHEEVAA